MEKIKAKITADGQVINKKTKEHIKTTKLKFIRRCIEDHGIVWIGDHRKKFTNQEKSMIRLENHRVQLKKLYKDYPDKVKTISDCPVVARTEYNTDIPEKQYGVIFKNGLSVYIRRTLFYSLKELPIQYANV